MAKITPTLAQLLVAAMDSKLDVMHTAIPCKVESYNAVEQTADLQPQIKVPIKTENGVVRYEEMPVLPDIPVAFPRGGGAGSGGFYISFPLQAGDFGLVVFSERSIDEWRSRGQLSEPKNIKKNPLQGAMFLPMGYPDINALTDIDSTNMSIGREAGANIKITPSDIIELSGNEDAASLASIVNSNFQYIYDFIDAHYHLYDNDGVPGVTEAGHFGGPTTPPTDVASTKVKIGSN